MTIPLDFGAGPYNLRQLGATVFDTSFANAPVGVAFLDRALRFVGVNEALAEMDGVPVEEHVGRTLSEVLPHLVPAIEPVLHRVLETGRAVLSEEVSWSQEDAAGAERYWLLRCYPAGDKNGVGMVVVETTERRQAEDALRRNQAQLEAVFEAVQDGISVWDMQGNLLLANESLARINGYASAQEMLRDLAYFGSVYELREGERFLPASEWPISRVLRGESIQDWELHGRRRDTGREWDFSYSGVPVFGAQGQQTLAVVITRDITKRKRAEEALRASERRYSALFDNKINGIAHCRVITDESGKPVDYQIVRVNEAYERITGIKEVDIEGRYAREVFPGIENLPFDYIGNYGRVALEGSEIRFEDFFAPLGQWLSIYAYSPLPGEFAAIFTDITAQKQAEAERDTLLAKQTRVAESLQQSLLLVPAPDAFPGIIVKTLYQPASDDALVGGDFYDVFALPDSCVALVVGDVAGKGLEAATYTAEIKFVLRAFLREMSSPAIALERLNQFIFDAQQLDHTMRGSTYVVAAVAVVNTDTGQVVCSTAGIEPPFILRLASGEAVEMGAGGPLPGAEERAVYDMQWEQMQPGDLLVMSTDGLTEARYGRRFFGYNGLVGAVRQLAHLESLAEIGRSVARQAQDFAGGKHQDDVSLACP